ncbi:MAG: DDE-type integrase/transposase/recombinase, partial [Bacteroidota bacterium]
LVGVFNKAIYDLPNPRLQRLREKLAAYTFTVEWVPGKTHLIADALSRAPVFQPSDDDELPIDTAISCLSSTQSSLLASLTSKKDADYKLLLLDVQDGSQNSNYIKQLQGVKERLSVLEDLVLLDAKRIVLPVPAIKDILKYLHLSHSGYTKTYELARQLYYWPGMVNDIKQLVASCSACQRLQASQPKNPMITDPPSSYLGPPFCHVGLDLFSFAGKTHLICVDQWSGFPLYKRLGATTVKAVTDILSSWFNMFGWPASIRSDGGPQFSSAFTQFCKCHGIDHQLSSPYNPKSNGLAESAVKSVKYILSKANETGENADNMLYNWRNTPRADGYSPAQLLFGRRQKTSLPMLPHHFLPVSYQEAAQAKDKSFLNINKWQKLFVLIMALIKPGSKVLLQDPKTGYWDQEAYVKEARADKQSYIVTSAGKEFIRSRFMIRPIASVIPDSGSQQQSSFTASSTSPASLPTNSLWVGQPPGQQPWTGWS